LRGVRRLTLAVVLLLSAAGVAAFVLLRPPAEPGDRVVLANAHGNWTIFTRCIPGVVGAGYVARLETGDGSVLVDDLIGPGTLNDTDFGGLGAFGWHHARGRPGELRFTADNAWEVSVRTCASANAGFGVVGTRVLSRSRTSLELEVDLSDGFTYPQPLMRVHYRYELEPDALRSWVTVTELCADGLCGRTAELAFLKEPKLVAHAGRPYRRLDVLDGSGRVVCSGEPGGPASGPILRTRQCDDPGRALVRFGPCEPDCLQVEASGWNGAADGFDAWAVRAATRRAAFAVDTESIDGVLWPCHGGDPAGRKMRRWELAGRRGGSLGVLLPAWEGGRGGYDCEPLARTFGASGESWRAGLVYRLVG
jgi:hypothetical protein